MSDQKINNTKNRNLNKSIAKSGAKALTAASCSFLMLTGIAIPAQAVSHTYQTNGVTAAPSHNEMSFEEYVAIHHPEMSFNGKSTFEESSIQTLKTDDYEESVLQIPEVKAEMSQEWLDEQERIREAEEAAAEAEAAAAAAAAEAENAANYEEQETAVVESVSYTEVPQGSGAQGLVNAARAQIGMYMDCTDLVQNSLAAIGLFERRDQGGYDLGPLGFTRFGTQIDPSQARAGDILAREGHVAVYTGDGVNHSAVHGGWNGSNVVESPYDADPYSYIVIRL